MKHKGILGLLLSAAFVLGACASLEKVATLEQKKDVAGLFKLYCDGGGEISKAAEKAFLNQGAAATGFLKQEFNKKQDDPYRRLYLLLISGETGDSSLVAPMYALLAQHRKDYQLQLSGEIALTNLARKNPAGSPLYYVMKAYADKPETMEAIKAGCDITKAGISGETPLKYAQKKSYTEIVKWLQAH